MSRTQGRSDGDLGYADGHIFIPASAGQLTSGTGTFTRNASGSASLNLGNSQTAVLIMRLDALIFRYGVQDWLQEQYGSQQAQGAQGLPVGGYTTYSTASISAGSNVNIAVKNSANFTVGRTLVVDTVASTVQEFPVITAIPDATHITVNVIANSHSSGCILVENAFTTPAGVTGPPPFTGVTNLTPVTAPRPKGILFREIYPVYAVAGAALTTNTIGLTKTVFSNNVAPAVTSLLTDAANGLATATNAQPYLTPIQIPSPAYQTTKFASYILEWDVTTAGGGTAELFGVFMDIGFNFN